MSEAKEQPHCYVANVPESDVARISRVLYEWDQAHGFCGHDIDAKAMKSIIQTIVLLLANPDLDSESLRFIADRGIDGAKAGASMRDFMSRMSIE